MRNLAELVVVAKSAGCTLEEILKIPLVRKTTNSDSSFIENWLRELLSFIERVEVIYLDTNDLRNNLLSKLNILMEAQLENSIESNFGGLRIPSLFSIVRYPIA